MKAATICRVLVYKRTHNGDPDPGGCFGRWNCMGTIRDHEFDAVIGVGGIGKKASKSGIAGKITWIGIGPHKRQGRCKPDGRIVTLVKFDHFKDFGDDMPDFRVLAKKLSSRMYNGKIRHLIADKRQPDEFREVKKILKMAKNTRPSSGIANSKVMCKLRCDVELSR